MIQFRPGQAEAVAAITDAFTRHDVVILDAAPGAGKTFIAEGYRQTLQESGTTRARTMYLCTTKQLQAQVLRDFPYAKLIMGRANYSTLDWPDDDSYTCDDCTLKESDKICLSCDGSDSHCLWCHPHSACPFQVAKRAAVFSDLAVSNMAYWLRETSNPERSQFAHRPLVIIDEADTLRDQILSYYELHIPRYLRLPDPQHVTKPESWDTWVHQVVLPGITRYLVNLQPSDLSPSTIRRRKALRYLASSLREADLSKNWVYENQTFKPLRAHDLAPQVVFSKGTKFLLMSGSVISPTYLQQSLGLPITNDAVVHVPGTFDHSRRPIVVRPSANASPKANQRQALIPAVADILFDHPSERVLIHSVSYDLAKLLVAGLKKYPLAKPRLITYSSSSAKINALDKFRAKERSVLIAPALDRGLDLPDDLCRVIVVAKVPYPNLGDKQVSARFYGGDKLGYRIDTLRTLIQMTSRGMRHDADWCISYLLDSQFNTRLYPENAHLIPDWWKQALDWTGRTPLGVGEYAVTGDADLASEPVRPNNEGVAEALLGSGGLTPPPHYNAGDPAERSG